MVKIVFLLILPIFLIAKEIHYSPFIDKQIQLTLELSKEDITEKEVDEIIAKKEQLFHQRIEKVLADKKYYLQSPLPYESEIYRLQKIIDINKKRGNTYAVIRDEVLIKSYRILQSQHNMMIDILLALDQKTFDGFSKELNEIFIKNQKIINSINNVDYHPYLAIATNGSSVINDMKQRIQEYYAIIDINAELLRDVINAQRKMYRLNKYYKYGLIKIALFVNHSTFSHLLEPILAEINLNTMKLLLIVGVIIFTFFFQYFAKWIFRFIFIHLQFRNALVKEILQGIKRPLDVATITIAINLIIYIYNDFSRTYFFSLLFDEIYVIVIMWSLYKILNILAKEKINSIAQKTTNVKSELINITVKIINFTILLFTVLLLLHFAGVNLTAILSGLGIGGFAIALAAKDSLANFFGTLSILMSNTFSQGDWIVIDEIEGVVVEIGLRVTTIRTFDNALISIPNLKLANEAIKNWNRRKIGRRIKFSFIVRYDVDLKQLSLAIEEIKNYLAHHEAIAKESSEQKVLSSYAGAKLVSKNDALGIKNTQLVQINDLEENGFEIMVYCFSITTDWIKWAKIKDEIILSVMEIMRRNNIEIALPSLVIQNYHNQNTIEKNNFVSKS